MKKELVKSLIKEIIKEATYRRKSSFKPLQPIQDKMVRALIQYISARVNVTKHYVTEEHGPVELHLYFSLLKPTDLITLMSILNRVNPEYYLFPTDELICLKIQFNKEKLKNMGIKL